MQDAVGGKPKLLHSPGMLPPRRRASHLGFLIILGVMSAALLAAPLPSWEMSKALLKLTFGHGRVVLLGASINDQVSKCDADQRNLASLLAADVTAPVRNASAGGQPVIRSADLASMALGLAGVDEVIVMLDPARMTRPDQQLYRDNVFFRAVHPDLYRDGPGSYLDLPRSYISSNEAEAPDIYNGQPIPSYDKLVATWFVKQKNRMPCPEDDGVDRGLIEAITYQGEIEPVFDPASLQLFAGLEGVARRSGKQAFVVLEPVDQQLMSELNASWPGLIRTRAEAASRILGGFGIPVLNLTDALPRKSDFIDRWCGCSHASQQGREMIAGLISNWLKMRPNESVR